VVFSGRGQDGLPLGVFGGSEPSRRTVGRRRAGHHNGALRI